MKRIKFSKKFLHLLRYSFGYILGAIAYFIALYLFTDHLHIHYVVSAIFSFFISIIIAYSISKVFAFREKLKDKYFIKLCKYTLTGGLAAPINLLILVTLTEFANFHYLVSALLGGLVGAITKYILDIHWCFKIKKC